MNQRIATCLVVLCASLSAAPPNTQTERIVPSVLPSLTYGSTCSSSVELSNLGDRLVTIGVEGHRSTGGLVPLIGQPGTTLLLGPGEHVNYKFPASDDPGTAWVKIAEVVPAPRLSPIVAVSGSTECLAGDQLSKTVRELVYPARNPWFSGDVSDIRGNEILIVNTSERPAQAWLCYSSGNLYAVPGESGTSQLTPLCSADLAVQVPPFSTRQFPVERQGNSYFSLKTQGSALVLQMLRPIDPSVRIYAVNSTITFGEEAP